jgi:hypothetical protein
VEAHPHHILVRYCQPGAQLAEEQRLADAAEAAGTAPARAPAHSVGQGLGMEGPEEEWVDMVAQSYRVR